MKAKLLGIAMVTLSTAGLLTSCTGGKEVPTPADPGECRAVPQTPEEVEAKVTQRNFCAKITLKPRCKADLETATMEITFTLQNQDPAAPWSYKWLVKQAGVNVAADNVRKIPGGNSSFTEILEVPKGTFATAQATHEGVAPFDYTLTTSDVCESTAPPTPAA